MIKSTEIEILNHLGDLNSITDYSVEDVRIIKEALE
jgi:hypothetical protein